jgi:hypothetical protein
MAPLKTLLSTAALAFFLLLGSAAPAAAGTTPCWKQVINDWYDGRIDNIYPAHCYQEAIAHLPEDVQTYSSAKDEINRALYASLRHDRDGGGGLGGSLGPTASGPSSPGGGEAPGGALTRLLESLGPSNAESVPLPLLVLAVIALLLLGAAAASFIARRIQAQRQLAGARPATAPAPARDGPKRP